MAALKKREFCIATVRASGGRASNLPAPPKPSTRILIAPWSSPASNAAPAGPQIEVINSL